MTVPMSKPLCIELFAGCFGWSAGWLGMGGRAVGFDLEHLPHHGPVPEGAELVIQDVLTLHGSQFKDADLILASPPCQAYSYRAMPWKRAKALPPPDNSLFDACFRIQREASEAAGRHIPMVVENVRGAQKWVGRAPWNYGSFYLWGDVPALMPIRIRGQFNKLPSAINESIRGKSPARWTNSAEHYFGPIDGQKVPGKALDGTKNSGGSWFAVAHNTISGHSKNPVLALMTNGTKIGGDWFSDPNSPCRKHGSRSHARKAASAQIAKIPFPLGDWIARCFWPTESERAA